MKDGERHRGSAKPSAPAIAIYYEHPDWFRPLFAELDRRRTPYVPIDANTHRYDPSETDSPFAVVFNRMSPSAYMRGGAAAVFYTTQFLAYLRGLGVRVINGYDAWQAEISKAYQLSLLEALGLPYPKTRVISDAAAAPAAAAGLRYPVVVKPNIGGSGAGIRRFDTPAELERAARDGELDLGIDRTALVQEFIPAESGRIVRVEVLGGHYLYAIRVYTTGDTFNLCPADVCEHVDGTQLERLACPADAASSGLRVEGYTPPAEIRTAVERITAATGIEIGGVEYVVDERDGRLYYYDVNALSNFVADAPNVVGFDPFARLADWLEDELARANGSACVVERADSSVISRGPLSPPQPSPAG